MTEVLSNEVGTLISYHEELVSRARMGEEEAVVAIYEDILPTIEQTAARYEYNQTERPDHVQGSLERLLRAYILPQPDVEASDRGAFRGNLRALAGTITRNSIFDAHRRQVNREGNKLEVLVLEDMQTATPLKDTPESEIIDNATGRIDTLLKLSGCTPDMAKVVKLRYIEGYSVKQVAEIMSSPLGTVLSRSKRGLECVKDFAGIKEDSPLMDIFANIPDDIDESAY